MEAKDSLLKIIKSLLEIDAPVSKPVLLDFLLGKTSREITEGSFDDRETFGCGDNHDDEFWNTLIDTACEKGFLKAKSARNPLLVVSSAGKKYLKKPTSFPLDEESDVADIPADSGLDEIVKNALDVKASKEASPRTRQQMKLIHAIDCKIALDDFAESESLGFDEVLEEAEKLIHQGRRLDITYFTDEVMGDESVSELVDYFRNAPTDDLDEALNEYGDVYNDMEIRLARIVYRVEQLGTKN